MRSNEAKRIKTDVPFLQEKTVLYVDSGTGEAHRYVEEAWEDLSYLFEDIGYKFLFLPKLADCLDPSLLTYMFPGRQEPLAVEDMYRRIQILAGLDSKAGFLYKQNGSAYFRALPESQDEIEKAIDKFVDFLSDGYEIKCDTIRFSKEVLGDSFFDISDEYLKMREPSVIVEEPLDPRTQKIIQAWEKLEKEFGITIQDLDIILGYRVKLSRLNITTAGKIILKDWDGSPEVKMDDLTKALYFFYLHHPEGVALKELQSHGQEILHHYMSITGRDDVQGIKKSIDTLIDPFGNNLNVSISRIKKAFKEIVGDRIARFYYVDGRAGEPRKVALDRDLVIWEH